ncbi:MAG TPA: hypothetical protein VEQ37_19875 [Actinomycetota bacterium]|jgi:hypothetical protein|nr:hypothetical protein [Actinomycetota bacterium]
MDTDIEVRTFDCPECRSTRSVLLGVCEVCFADFGERDHSAPALFVDRLLRDLNLDDPGFGPDDRRA